MIEEGRKQGLVVTGHLRSYPVDDAIAHGIDSLDTSSPSPTSFAPTRKTVTVSTSRATRRNNWSGTIADSGVFVDPTLSVFWGTLFFVDVDEVVNHPDNLKMPRPLQDFWAVDPQEAAGGLRREPTRDEEGHVSEIPRLGRDASRGRCQDTGGYRRPGAASAAGLLFAPGDGIPGGVRHVPGRRAAGGDARQCGCVARRERSGKHRTRQARGPGIAARESPSRTFATLGRSSA